VVESGVDQRHRYVLFAAVGVGQDHRRIDGVVPLAKDRGGHLERLAHHGLGRERAVLDAGGDLKDRNTSERAGGSRG